MCMSSPKMPKVPGPTAGPAPIPQPTAMSVRPSDAAQKRLETFGGSGASLLSRLRIPLNIGT